MKALLLAAGLGTRLRPLTKLIPKCLVPINGKPLLQYWLENLTKAGVDEFLINLHYLPDQVREFIDKSEFKEKITLVYEDELLLTGGTLLKNESFFGAESFMLVHADNLTFCNFNDFISTHKKRPINTIMTMMTFDTDTPESCGIVRVNNSGIVEAFYEKVKSPPSNLANGAVYILEPEIFNYLKGFHKEKVDFSTEIIPMLINKIVIFHNEIYHRDIGNLESYAIANADLYFKSKG